MGLLPSAIRLLLKLHTKYSFEGPVLTLGNQDTWATHQDLIRYFKDAKLEYTPFPLIPHSSRTFHETLELESVAKDFVHARTLFGMLGMSDYSDMDKFDSDHPVYLHDLNQPVPLGYHNKFSLIIDGGTTEHIYDVNMVMQNIFHMLKPNGCVVHMAAFNIDHGFYAFSPCFYFDFYKANEFTELSCYIVQFNLENVSKTYKNTNPCFEYTYGMSLNGLVNFNKEIMILFLARKHSGAESIVVPTQGIFDPVRKAAPADNNKLQEIYRSLPPFFQSICLTAYRYKTRFIRYRERKRIAINRI